MIIGIDSAENMTYTGIISGSLADIYSIYERFAGIFQKRGVNPPFHWRKISRKVKDSSMKVIIEAINSSRLKINVFEHKRLPNAERKVVFYELLPQHICLRLLPWTKELTGNLTIEVDDDYRIKGKFNITKAFAKSLVENMCFQLIGMRVDSRDESDTIKATIKLKKGILNIYGKVMRSDNSKAIQMVDIILGYFIHYQCRDFSRSHVHHWKIFKN